MLADGTARTIVPLPEADCSGMERLIAPIGLGLPVLGLRLLLDPKATDLHAVAREIGGDCRYSKPRTTSRDGPRTLAMPRPAMS